MPDSIYNIIPALKHLINSRFSACLLLLSITFGGSLLSQNPVDTVKTDSVNTELIAKLVREGIDSVRKAAGLNPLQPDSLLILAATDHALWLVRQRTLTHEQPSSAKSSVQKRAEYFGAERFLCGENIAASYIADLMVDKSGRKYRNITYRQIADEFVWLWINSSSHNTNIINPVYGFTGVAISYHPGTRRVVAVQVFGYMKKNKG